MRTGKKLLWLLGLALVLVLTMAVGISLAGEASGSEPSLTVTVKEGLVYTGSPIDPAPVVKNGDEVISLTDEDTISYFKDGEDTPLTEIIDAGAYKVKVTVMYAPDAETAPVDISAEAAFTVSQAEIQELGFEAAEKAYTGSNLRADVKLKFTVNPATVTLSETTDYTVEAPDEIIDANDYTFTVTLTNNNVKFAEGVSNTAMFKVTKPAVTITWPTANSTAYTGTDITKPVPASVAATGYTVKETDYTIGYSEETIIDAKTYTVTVTPVNNNLSWPEQLTWEYTVNKAKVTVIWPTENSAVYDGIPKSIEKPTVSSDTVTTLTEGTDYEITSSATGDVLNAGEYSYSVVLKNNNLEFSTGTSDTWTYTVTKAKVAVTWPEENSTVYDRNVKTVEKPDVYSDMTLTEGTDYEITSSATGDVLNAGEYSYSVVLKNDNLEFNTGILDTWTYTVTKAQVKAAWEAENTIEYTGAEITELPKPVVTCEGLEFTEDTDFTIGYEPTPVKDAGTYSVVVTLKDGENFEFQDKSSVKNMTLTVKQAIITAIELETDGRVYNPNTTTYAADLQATVKAGDIELAAGDYVLSASTAAMKDRGDYTITAAIINTNFKADSNVKATYTIAPANIANLHLGTTTAVYKKAAYTTADLGATVYAYINGTEGETFEVESSAYTLSSSGELKNADNYDITAQFNSENYTGDNPSAEFTITPAKLGMLELGQTESTYDGNPVNLENLKALAGTKLSTTGEDASFDVDKLDYTLTCDGGLTNAGEYSINIELQGDGLKNYTIDAVSDVTYKIQKAEVTSLTVDPATVVYSQTEIDLSTLEAELKAGDITVTEPYTLTAYQGSESSTIKDIGEYTIKAKIDDEENSNFSIPEGISATFTVGGATLDTLTLGETERVYNVENPVTLDELKNLEGTVLTAAGGITVSKEDYDLVVDPSFNGPGEYTITVQLKESSNYLPNANTKATYTLNAAYFASLVFGKAERIYDQQAHNPNDLVLELGPKVTDEFGNEVNSEYYTLKCDEEIKDAGEYTITVELTDSGKNYYTDTNNVSATLMVKPATVSAVVLGKNTSVYNRQEVIVSVENLLPTVTAVGEADAELTVPNTSYTLAKAIETDEMIDAGEHQIKVVLNDTKNYQFENNVAVEATYTITPATIAELSFGTASLVYRNSAYAPEADIKGTYVEKVQPKVMAKGNEGEENFEVPLTDVTFSSKDNQEILDAGDYTIVATAITNNYVKETTVETGFEILKATLTSITFENVELVYRNEAYAPEADIRVKYYSTVKPEVIATANEGETFVVPIEGENTHVAFSSKDSQEILEAGDYTIVATAITNNYNATTVETGFKILPATLKSITFTPGELVYRNEAYAPEADIRVKYYSTVKPEVIATANEGETFVVPIEGENTHVAFSSKGNQEILKAGDYTIVATAITNNYEKETTVETGFKILPATLKSITFTPGELVYRNAEYDPEADIRVEYFDTVNPVVIATANKDETFEVPIDGENTHVAFSSKGNQEILEAGDYTIVATAITDDYEKETTVETGFKILPATLKSITFTPGELVYRNEAYDPEADIRVKYFGTVKPEVIATSNEGQTFIVPIQGEEAHVAFSSKDDQEILNAGDYTIIATAITDNYVKKTTVETGFKILQATLKEITLNPDTLVYDPNRMIEKNDEEDVNLKAMEAVPTVIAIANAEEEFTVPYEQIILSTDKEIHKVDEYTITATPGTDNYTTDVRTATLTITRKKVDPIVITINGSELNKNRLGGPDESKYHSIDIVGQENEAMTITITNGSETLEIKAAGKYTVKISNHSITFEGKTIQLDQTGDIPYKITANYDDAFNLKTGEDDTQQAQPVEATFYYDMSCKPVSEAARLKNRTDTGIHYTAEEDYASIVFTAGGENSFTVSAENVRAGTYTLEFAGVKKLFSTEHNPGNTYSATCIDDVGNKAVTEGWPIERCNGTLNINSVNPAPNESGWISKTPSLTWSVTMTSDGGLTEETILSVGTYNKTYPLNQGENGDLTMDTGSLTKDQKMSVTIRFDDLNGTATFQSIGYDEKADVPVLTTKLYDGCNVLAGIVEPNVRVTIMVNGESIVVNSDRWGGFFTDQLPLAYEGDIVTVRYVDKAGNTVTLNREVGPMEDPVQLDAYMFGKVRTNAHTIGENEMPLWVNVLKVTEEELKSGIVTLPIIAGNVVEVGQITIQMDENNKVYYRFKLNEGINQSVNETVVIDPNNNADELMVLNGIRINPDGTLVTGKGKNPTYSIVAKFVVEVPAENLEATFQTASDKTDDLKAIYVQRQTQKALSKSK